MLIFPIQGAQPASPIVVQIPGETTDFDKSIGAGTGYVGIRFQSDGTVQARTTGGSWYGIGTWLFDGASSGYYLITTLEGGYPGTFNSVDSGRGPLQMNQTLSFSLENDIPAVAYNVVCKFDISDDSMGSNIVVTRTINFVIEVENEGGG